MTGTMRAVVLDAPGPPDALRIRELPIPEPRTGWALIDVKAFGLNRSELHARLGLSKRVTFPRVLGIEAVGVVAAAPDGELEEGQQAIRAFNIYEVQRMMGHRHITTTERYLHYAPDPDAAAKLSGLWQSDDPVGNVISMRSAAA